MLGDNLQKIRKQKGMSQEELAARIHVVRQTVSKWEKNLSVPDAQTLQKIAEALDVSVNQILGATQEETVKDESDENEIAQQLARINEQLAIKNRRSGRIIKTIVIVIVALFALKLLAAAILMPNYASKTSNETVTIEAESEEVGSTGK